MADYPQDQLPTRNGCARQVLGMFTVGTLGLIGFCMFLENYVLAGVKTQRSEPVAYIADAPPPEPEPESEAAAPAQPTWKMRLEQLYNAIVNEEPVRPQSRPDPVPLAEQPGTLSTTTSLPTTPEPPALYPSRELTQADILVFLTDHHDRAADRVPDGWVADFTDPVDYLSDGVISRSRLLQQQIARHEEWLHVSESMTRMATATKIGKGWMVVYGITIREENALSQWLEQDVDVELMIEVNNNEPKISSIRYLTRAKRGSGEIPGSPSANGFWVPQLR